MWEAKKLEGSIGASLYAVHLENLSRDFATACICLGSTSLITESQVASSNRVSFFSEPTLRPDCEERTHARPHAWCSLTRWIYAIDEDGLLPGQAELHRSLPSNSDGV
jgi:hypothetical protein